MGDVIRFPVRPRPRPVDPFQRARDDLLRVLFGPQGDDRRPCDVQEPEEAS